MFEAEFTHEGDRCTFEVLLERVGLGEPRARARSPRSCTTSTSRTASSAAPEADGIRTLIAGICTATGDDEERLARGAGVFEDLYRSFPRSRGRPPR